MDMQFGLSMAKVFDPGTNMQVSVSGNFLNILFSLFIFATNSHLLLVRIFATSFQIVPAGFTPFSPHVSGYIADLLSRRFRLRASLGSALYRSGVCAGSIARYSDEVDPADSCLCNQFSTSRFFKPGDAPDLCGSAFIISGTII